MRRIALPVLAFVTLGVLAACSGHPTSTASVVVPPPVTSNASVNGVVAATAGAVSVTSTGAVGDGTGDDTAAFLRAEDAALASSFRLSGGPSGQPQAVLYVPPGTYPLLHLAFRSNVRLEVDAAAVLEQAGGRNVNTTKAPAALIDWDAPAGPPLSNVTIIGVNSFSTGLKLMASPVFPGWDVSPDFTFDLDPAATNGNEKEVGLQARNVTGFLIQNVYSIQNDSQPATLPATVAGWWPETQKAALGLRENPATPADGSVYYDPHNGLVFNWYNIHGPKGYGPNQVGAVHDVQFEHVFTQGGTALRLETDASQGKAFASEIRGLQASDIVGLDCNRAVSFTPHAQNNYDVTVTNVTALNCADGVMESISPVCGTCTHGSFINASVSDITVTGGYGAQNGTTGGLWTVGVSLKAFAKDKSFKAPWSVLYGGTITCQGQFQLSSDPIRTILGLGKPTCS